MISGLEGTSTSCEDDLDLSWDEPLHGFTDTEKDTARKLNPFGKYLDPSILNVVNSFPKQ